MNRRLATVMYPFILLGSTAAAMLLLSRGVSPPVVLGTVLGCVVAVLVISERALRSPRRWKASRRELLTDLCHTAVNAIVPQGYGLLLQFAVVTLVSFSPVVGSLWPSAAPFWAQVLGAILLGELTVYAMHRFIHARESLWRFHRIHHGPEGLYWLNALRFHPVDLLLMNAASLTPLVLLGAPPELLAVYAVFSQTGSFLQHWNVEFDGRAWKWIFNTPEHHAWHHSSELSEANHNFGGALVVWDAIFGTLNLRENAKPNRPGPGTSSVPMRYRDQLLAPFRGEPNA